MKPYIVCHMIQSIDGRIACDMVDKIIGDEYYTADIAFLHYHICQKSHLSADNMVLIPWSDK